MASVFSVVRQSRPSGAAGATLIRGAPFSVLLLMALIPLLVAPPLASSQTLTITHSETVTSISVQQVTVESTKTLIPVVDIIGIFVTLYAFVQFVLRILQIYMNPMISYELKWGWLWGSEEYDTTLDIRVRNHGLRQVTKLRMHTVLSSGSFVDYEFDNPKQRDFTMPNPLAHLRSEDFGARPEDMKILPTQGHLIAMFPKFPRCADVTIRTKIKSEKGPFIMGSATARVDALVDEGEVREYTAGFRSTILTRKIELVFYGALFVLAPVLYLFSHP